MTKLAKLRHLLHGRSENMPHLTGVQTSKARSSSTSTPTAAVLTGITQPAAVSTGSRTRHHLPLEDNALHRHSQASTKRAPRQAQPLGTPQRRQYRPPATQQWLIISTMRRCVAHRKKLNRFSRPSAKRSRQSAAPCVRAMYMPQPVCATNKVLQLHAYPATLVGWKQAVLQCWTIALDIMP